jgi:uncharacterized Tic20 family protein
MVKKEETPETSESPGGKANADTSEDVEQGQVSAEVNKEACMWAMFCHLAGLAGIVIPAVGNIVGPLILWQIKKDEYPFVDEQGKEAVNFQISMTIYGLICIPLFFICIGPFLLAAVGVVDLVFLLIAAVKANNGQHYRYPLTIRFIK